MARNIRWQIPFTSDAGTQYTVNIYDEDYNGSIVTLFPSEEPFEVQEDDDDDFFLPIRTSSGYLSFISEGRDWEAIMPTSGMGRYVTLTQGGNVRWQGYINPESFTSPWERVTDHDLPIVCPLIALQSEYLDYDSVDNMTYISIGQFIFDCIQKCQADIDVIKLPLLVKNVNTFLGLKFAVRNFYDVSSDIEKDVAAVFETDTSYLDVLSSICALFGMTARIEEDSFVFTSHDGNTSFLSFSYQALEDFLDDVTITPTTVSISETAIDTLSPYGNDNSTEFMPGRKSVEIEGSVNEMDDIEFPIDRIFKADNDYQIQEVQDSYGTRGTLYLRGEQNYNSNWQSRTYNWDDMSIMIGGRNTVATRFQQSAAYQFDSTDTAEEKRTYDFSDVITVVSNIKNSDLATWDRTKFLFRLDDNVPRLYTYGCISLQMNLDKSYYQAALMELKLDGKYYYNTWHYVDRAGDDGGGYFIDSEGWSNSPAHFLVPICSGQGEQRPRDVAGQFFKTPEDLNIHYNDAEGYCIYINHSQKICDAISVRLLTLVYSHEDDSGGRASNITKFAIQFTPYKTFNRRLENPKYIQRINAGFKDDESIDLDFACDSNNSRGWGNLANADNSKLTGYTFVKDDADYIRQPERMLLDRAVVHYTKTVEKVSYSASNAQIKVSDRITDGNKKLAIISIGRNYIHDVTILNLQEI